MLFLQNGIRHNDAFISKKIYLFLFMPWAILITFQMHDSRIDSVTDITCIELHDQREYEWEF